jgi:two-component system, NtrC family, sensor kinase
MENLLAGIIEKIDVKFGQAFFDELTLQLDKVISSDYTFIARLNVEKHTSTTVSLVAAGALVENFEYSLAGTPCDDVANDSVCLYPKGVCEYFPQDQLLVDMEIEGYLGTPLYDSHGKVMGIVVALYKQEIVDQEITLALFKLFSSRIASEFERIKREQQLVELNNTLDKRVKERTKELEGALRNLESTQEKLIEVEKMSALGQLVSGVAHEVNTPLGIAITSASVVNDILSSLCSDFKKELLTKARLDKYLHDESDALAILICNLQRAKELIDSFKNIAVEQADISVEKISLSEYYHVIAKTLSGLLKTKSVELNITSCNDDTIATLPGYHAQVLTHLVTNSLEHGFNNTQGNQIDISISRLDQNTLSIKYCDNGSGFKDVDVTKIYEPFYTTKRSEGNTGLGLSIVYNIVVQQFKGDLYILESENGFCLSFDVTESKC